MNALIVTLANYVNRILSGIVGAVSNFCRSASDAKAI